MARLAIALPETSRDAHAERQRVDERPDDDVAALLGLRRVDVVDVQRVVVHRDQAEEVVVGLGDRLGGPVLVDGADLELLEVAAVGVGAGGLARGLLGLDAAVVSVLMAADAASSSALRSGGRHAQPPRLRQAARRRRSGPAARDPRYARRG